MAGSFNAPITYSPYARVVQPEDWNAAWAIANGTSAVASATTLNNAFYRVLVSGATEVSLPTAVGISGKEYNVIRVGTDNVTITPDGAETISGDANFVLTSQWDSVSMVSDGSDWVRCG